MSIPISALQRNAAEAVRKVAASGVPEPITDRGRVVAILAPPPHSSGLQRLRESGLTRRAVAGALSAALEDAQGAPALDLTAALAEQRDADR